VVSKDIVRRAKKIRLLLLDCDGVLTDGKVYFFDSGVVGKAFDIRDGFGITLLDRAGIPVVIVTAQKSTLVVLRARQLKIKAVYEAKRDKLKAYRTLTKRFGVRDDEVCFVGDDLIDIPIARRAGLPVAVPAAAEELKKHARYVTKASGGAGAVREIIEIILRAQGLWKAIVDGYRR